MNGLCARLLNKIHTVKCINKCISISNSIGVSVSSISRVGKGVIVLSAYAPVILTIYLHVIARAVVDRDMT